MRATHILPCVLSCVLVLLLAACSGGDVRNTLGLNRKAPDEFRVLARPPLTVPPEFTLRPPQPGQELPVGLSPRDDAAAAVLGPEHQTLEQKAAGASADSAIAPVTAGSLASPADANFLNRVGGEAADPNIRTVIQQEQIQAEQATEEEGFLSKLGSKKTKEPEVDPKGEAARIERNKAENKPITEGETPTTQEKKKEGLLQGLFK